MKANFFNNKYFFGVLVVFAVVFLFLVFFGVVRAQGQPLVQHNYDLVPGAVAVGERADVVGKVENQQNVIDDIVVVRHDVREIVGTLHHCVDNHDLVVAQHIVVDPIVALDYGNGV